jgi:cytidylate kinase
MTVWTIDAEPGTGGREIARRLAGRAGVPLVDQQFTIALALELGTTVHGARAVEHAVGGPLLRLGFLFGMSTRCAPELAQELERIRRCRSVFEEVARAAGRFPCVIVGREAYAALAGHPGARHVRIRAPREWRSRQLAASACLPLATARRRVARADRERRARSRGIFGRRLDEPDAFHLVCDASRLAPDDLLDLLLVLGPQSVRGIELAGAG